MPCYDYRCADCLEVFEASHAGDAPAPACPACAGAHVERIWMSAPAVHDGRSRGRDAAIRSLPECGKGCRCCP